MLRKLEYEAGWQQFGYVAILSVGSGWRWAAYAAKLSAQS